MYLALNFKDADQCMRLYSFEILDFYGCKYVDFCLLGGDAV
jgi:hypothetical protein